MWWGQAKTQGGGGSQEQQRACPAPPGTLNSNLLPVPWHSAHAQLSWFRLQEPGKEMGLAGGCPTILHCKGREERMAGHRRSPHYYALAESRCQ